jgi:hypothetical protein
VTALTVHKVIPGRARYTAGGLNCGTKDDELDAVNDRRAAAASYEWLHERAEGVHAVWAIYGVLPAMVGGRRVSAVRERAGWRLSSEGSGNKSGARAKVAALGWLGTRRGVRMVTGGRW